MLAYCRVIPALIIVERFKYTWPDYLPSAPHAAILVIDASNAQAFSNTRKVLHDICAHKVRVDPHHFIGV